MYEHTPKSPFHQERFRGQRGFTLVEIMIVIVIIILLTQLGNIGGLFRGQERGKLDAMNGEMLAMIDKTKTDALLGKTEGGDIVQKRFLEIARPATNEIELKERYNLARTISTLTEKEIRSWSLPDLSTKIFGCPGTANSLIGDDITPLFSVLTIEFLSDKINFYDAFPAPLGAGISSYPHLVLVTEIPDTSWELHIDRRTGLTYDRPGTAGIAPACE